PFRKEFFRYSNGLSQIPTRIGPQIKYNPFHAFVVEAFHCLHKLFVRSSSKAIDFNIAGFTVQHVGGIDRIKRDIVAGDRKFEIFALMRTLNGYIHFRSLRAAQCIAYILITETNSAAIIYLDNTIARSYAQLVARASRNSGDNGNGVLYNIKLDAHTLEFAGKAVFHSVSFVRLYIDRVRIKRAEHGLNGIFRALSHILFGPGFVDVAVNLFEHGNRFTQSVYFKIIESGIRRRIFKLCRAVRKVFNQSLYAVLIQVGDIYRINVVVNYSLLRLHILLEVFLIFAAAFDDGFYPRKPKNRKGKEDGNIGSQNFLHAHNNSTIYHFASLLYNLQPMNKLLVF